MRRGTVPGSPESDRCEVVEGNVYFPPEAVNREYLRDSGTHTVCGWKGTAGYYDVVVDGQPNPDAAWYRPEPMDAAANIRDHIAFWKGVEVVRWKVRARECESHG